jgi:hypothetical protein
VLGIVTVERRSFTVTAKIVVGAVTTLVADAGDFVVAAIADDAIVRGIIDLECEFAWVGDGHKAVTPVVNLGQGKALFAEVIVWALEALVANTGDDDRANVAIGPVLQGLDLCARAGLNGHGGSAGAAERPLDGCECVFGMVSLSGEGMACLAQVVVVTVSALVSNALDGIHANIAKDIGVHNFFAARLGRAGHLLAWFGGSILLTSVLVADVLLLVVVAGCLFSRVVLAGVLPVGGVVILAGIFLVADILLLASLGLFFCTVLMLCLAGGGWGGSIFSHGQLENHQRGCW